MAISKQNRVIGTVAIFFLIATGILFSKYEKKEISHAIEEFSTEKISVNSEIPLEINKNHTENLKSLFADLNSCFKTKTDLSGFNSKNLINDFLSLLAKDLGEPTAQVDRWNSWRLMTPEGNEKEYRLEIVETDDGKIRRELYAFVFDQSGEPIPTELSDEVSLNPSMDDLSSLLNEGQVFNKVKASSNVYTGGERLDFVESNGELKEIELTKFNQTFKCTSVETRKSCQCLNQD